MNETPPPEPRKQSHRAVAAVVGIAAIGAGAGIGAYAVVDASRGSTPAAAAPLHRPPRRRSRWSPARR